MWMVPQNMFPLEKGEETGLIGIVRISTLVGHILNAHVGHCYC